jgi:hypothetical protein
MTRTELKDRIRKGLPMPGVPGELFQEAYAEVLREDYPGSQIVTLLESRSSSAGLPAGIHERVARMLDASHARRDHVRRLTESHTQSDLKDDAHEVVDPILRAAAERFKASNHPDAVTARAANRDGPPRPFRLYPKTVTLQEAKAEADRLPKGIHAFVASRM